jgi:hypothetical protein
MRPSVAPLISAFTALHESEKAERMGDIESALNHALLATNHANEWADSLRLFVANVIDVK